MMRRASKLISLLLMAVMVLTLLPAAAFAAPPQSDPTHRHNWVVVSEKKATCTQAGTKTWRCTLCGKTYTETTRSALGHSNVKVEGKAPTCTEPGLTDGYKCSRCGAITKWQQAIPALGHDWDEGKITTEPSGFTPGVRTFTCQHDPSHTRTEEIDPSPWLFATFTGSFPDFTTFDLATKDLTPLTITEQPVGGSITRYSDETVPLHVAATGGVGEYTYQWYSQRLVSFHTFGLSSYNWPSAVGDNSPDYAADIGLKKYFCVVTDEAGNTAASEYANVEYKLSIAKQPDNANLQPTGKATLTCEAMDGSGSYSYRWYNSDLVFQGKGVSLPVSEEGDYFCTVEDNVTGETVDSEMCTVYSTDPFRLASISEDCTLVPKENVMLVASFTGGVEDYEIWWDKDGGAIDSTDGTDAAGNVVSYVDTAEAGVYTVHGVDSMYATASGTVTVTAPKLTIVRQPEGGTIPKRTYAAVGVIVSDGEAPYTYTLMRNGENYNECTEDNTACAFAVWYPGNYYIHIEDSKGRSIDSDVVYLEDAVFRVKKQTESAEIATPEGTATLEVEVEGGAEPYTYEWTVGSGWSWFKTGANEPTLTAKKPGYYSCRIKDKDGGCIKSKTIKVSYTGKKPWILSVTPDRIIGVGETTKLTCTAISGTGDDSNLRYDWYSKKPDGGWTLFAANAQTTETAFAWQYRCKVTDTVSGEYSTSEITTVSEELVLTDIKKYQESQSFTLYTLSFRGGTAPYACTVYLKYPYWNGTTTEYKDVIEDIFIVHSLEELKQREWFSPLENQVWYIKNTSIGERYEVEYAQHYLVIYDASGQKVKSPIFTYRDS